MSTYVLMFFGNFSTPLFDNVCIFNVTDKKFKELYLNKYHPSKDWSQWMHHSHDMDSLEKWEYECKKGKWPGTVKILDVWEE